MVNAALSMPGGAHFGVPKNCRHRPARRCWQPPRAGL